jgi:AcrR family transcriptional regulator
VNGDTATRLVETAERLFAERGVHGVSLREIGAEAGQRNTGAVRYHFGTKAQLLDAVFEHRMVAINAHRLALLEELDGCGRGHELRGLAEAFLYPLAEMLGEPGRPSWYLRFCVHAAYVEGTAPRDLEAQDWTRGVAIISARYRQVLAEAGVPEQLREERWSLLSGHMTHALADRELLVQHWPRRVSTPRAAFLATVLDTAVALAGAPVSDHTAQHITDRRSA